MTVAQKSRADKPKNIRGKREHANGQVQQKLGNACAKNGKEESRAQSSLLEQAEQWEQLDQLDSQIKAFLQEVSEELARETGFVKRKRAISGAVFAQGLIFGWMINPQASYTQLQQMLAIQGCTASAQALEKRMNERGADFLLSLIHGLLGVCAESEGVLCQLLKGFNGVYLQDGTLISLPNSLEQLYQGCGGNGEQAARSSLRIQVRLNLSTGGIEGPWVQEATFSERKGAASSEQTPLPAGSLRVTDAAYVTLAEMKLASDEGRFWLTHARADWQITDRFGIKRSLQQFLQARGDQSVIDEWVSLGSQANTRQRVRLIAMAVSQATHERREQQAQSTCKTRPKGSRRDVRVGKSHQRPSIDGRHRKKTSPKRQALLGWTILLTNVSEDRLAPHEARVLMRARWQIELLWRLWKERGQIDLWRSEKPMRILCEIYAKLIGQVIQHWLILRGCWDQPHRSLVKASQAVHLLALTYLLSLSGPITTQRVKELLRLAMQRSLLNTRPTRFSTSQFLEEPTRVLA